MDDLALRSLIYRRFVATGTAPSRPELMDIVGADVDAQLRRLHDAHMIVLDERPRRQGEIRMALPFAAEPTDYRVTTDSGAWWANCAWDALAVCAALGQDATIDSVWTDSAAPMQLQVTAGELNRSDGHIHFEVPARHWWDDIVRT